MIVTKYQAILRSLWFCDGAISLVSLFVQFSCLIRVEID